ncbi:MAG: TetR/AcrR family transcriptional regulator [Actinomycetota bacterium]|nr:TetR/AcrR family transcriptional regulator [Actinomycetota bacterium]
MSRIRKLREMIAEPAPGDEGFPFPPWQRPAREAPKARNVLSRDRIVDVALQIIDAEGTEAVSMRRIATELDTGAASLYAYVAGKDEVLALAHDEVISGIEAPDMEGNDWQGMVRSWAQQAYRIYSQHQDIARLSFAEIPTGPKALDVVEKLLSGMLEGGVPPQLAAWLMDRLALYVGADAFEGWIFARKFAPTDPEDKRSPEERGESWFVDLSGYFSSLPADRYPAITGNIEALMTGGGDARFEFGLETMIQGVAAMAEKQRTTQPSEK